MATLASVIQRGTRASQPAATAVSIGTLYSVTDEANKVERSNGVTWDQYAPSGGGNVTTSATLTSGMPILGNGGTDVTAAATGALLLESGTSAKISALSADASPTTDDLLLTVNDPGGTPANKKVTIANLVKQIGLIGYTSYAPATNTTVSTTSTTLAAIDGTNLTLTFTAPQSGKVLGRLSAFADISTSAQHYQWAILDGSNALVSGASVGPITLANGAPISGEFIVTGLTPGNSYTWKWAHGVTGGATGRTIYGPGVTSTTVSTSNMVKPAVMEVWAVQ